MDEVTPEELPFPPPCDILLFVTTQTEEEQLRTVTSELAIPIEERGSRIGTYFDLGTLGANRVLAVRTRIGSHRYRGAAWSAILFKNATGATGLIAVGMAFGTRPGEQSLGDVLVATSLIAYDARRKQEASGLTATDYPLLKPMACRRSLREMMKRHYESAQRDQGLSVHFGPMLSGGAQIQSASYRDRLVENLMRAFSFKDGPPIGGDMEGVGLLAASDPEDPGLIVVKGVSDWGDDPSGQVVEANRARACANALRFVIGALRR